MSENSDIKENVIYNEDPKLMELLLIDRTKTTKEELDRALKYANQGSEGYELSGLFRYLEVLKID